MKSEERYYDVATAWYERWDDGEAPLAVRFCSVSCLCPRCRQADFNFYFVHGMPLEVRGL